MGERLRKGVESTPIHLDSGEEIKVTVSVGISERRKNDSVQDLIDRSDKALYHAKQNGRNRTCLNVEDNSLFLV